MMVQPIPPLATAGSQATAPVPEGVKRQRDTTDVTQKETINPPAKKRRREKAHQKTERDSLAQRTESAAQLATDNFSPFDVLIEDARNHILTFLPFRDVLQFERSIKKHLQYTPARWKELLKQRSLDFGWSDLQVDKTYPDPDRCRFLIGVALQIYIFARQQELAKKAPEVPQLDNLHHRFEGLMLRQPSFGGFVWTDLTFLSNKLKLTVQTEHKKQWEEYGQKRSQAISEAGDLLMDGLLALQPAMEETSDNQLLKIGRVHTTFLSAIQKGATCTSLLALNFFLHRHFPQFYWDLAVFSATQNNDYVGMDLFLKEFPSLVEILYSHGVSFPPVLFAFAQNLNDQPDLKEQLLDRAITGYSEEKTPLSVWQAVATLQMERKNFIKAERPFDIVAKSGVILSGKIWHHRAKVKYKLGKFEEADKSCDEAFKAYKDKSPLNFYILAAKIKSRCDKSREAGWFYVEYLTAKKLNPQDIKKLKLSAPIWMSAARKEMDSERPESLQLSSACRAVSFADRAIALSKDEVPPAILAIAAEAYDLLGKASAIRLLMFKSQTLDEWVKSNKIHYGPEAYKIAQQHSEEAIAGYKEQVPPQVWAIDARVQYHSNEHMKALKSSDQALRLYGERVPIGTRVTHAKIHAALKHFDDARKLYQSIIDDLGNQVPGKILHQAGKVCVALNDHPAAEGFYDRALEKFGEHAKGKFLKELATIKKALNRNNYGDFAMRALDKADF